MSEEIIEKLRCVKSWEDIENAIDPTKGTELYGRLDAKLIEMNEITGDYEWIAEELIEIINDRSKK